MLFVDGVEQAPAKVCIIPAQRGYLSPRLTRARGREASLKPARLQKEKQIHSAFVSLQVSHFSTPQIPPRSCSACEITRCRMSHRYRPTRRTLRSETRLMRTDSGTRSDKGGK